MLQYGYIPDKIKLTQRFRKGISALLFAADFQKNTDAEEVPKRKEILCFLIKNGKIMEIRLYFELNILRIWTIGYGCDILTSDYSLQNYGAFSRAFDMAKIKDRECLSGQYPHNQLMFLIYFRIRERGR